MMSWFLHQGLGFIVMDSPQSVRYLSPCREAFGEAFGEAVNSGFRALGAESANQLLKKVINIPQGRSPDLTYLSHFIWFPCCETQTMTVAGGENPSPWSKSDCCRTQHQR